jgi:hypothetical protein
LTTSPRILAAVAAAALAAGCGDDGVCGPEMAPPDGVTAETATGASVGYQGFTSSPNNDCTPPDRMPTSITLDGVQVGQSSFHITFCLPRPDQLGSRAVDIADTDLIEVIDINARLDADCLLVLDRSSPPTGTITFSGYCADGLDDAGYAISFAASVPGTVVCTGQDDAATTITLAGESSVEAL